MFEKRDIFSKTFKPQPFTRQTQQTTCTGDNIFIAQKMPADCGIICLHYFKGLYNCLDWYNKDRGSLDQVKENWLAELREQMLTLINNLNLMYASDAMIPNHKEAAGLVMASLTQRQAYGDSMWYNPSLEPVLIDCGFIPIVTAKNGNSVNDVRVYARVLNPPVHVWNTSDEKIEVT